MVTQAARLATAGIGLTLLLVACGGGGGGGGSAGDTQVGGEEEPRLFTLSGSVTAASGTFADTDSNDPLAPYRSNDVAASAQQIPNPSMVGGFASALGTGRSGDRFAIAGDLTDAYEVLLADGQTVSLSIADYRPDSPGLVDLDLYLYDAADSTTPVADSLSSGEREVLRAPYAGRFHILVRAVQGYSNYLLSIGQSPLQQTTGFSTLSSADLFVAGELIASLHDTLPSSGRGSERARARLAELGIAIKAGGAGRPRLLGLGGEQQRRAALAALGSGSAEAEQNTGQWGLGEKRERIETLLLMKALANQPEFVGVGLNFLRHSHFTPNDRYYPLQWHYPLINLPQAWDVSAGDGVVVAVLDTGVLFTHSDLAGRLTSSGYDFVSSPEMSNDGDGIDSNPGDPGDGRAAGVSSFHGTHVTGILAAATQNGIGVAGAAWGATVMPVRVLGQGGGTDYDLLQGVRYAAGLSNDSGTLPETPAAVINISLGGGGFSQAFQDTVDAVRARGVILVASAGNNGSSTPVYPAAYNGVVSVTAVRYDKALAGYASFGATIDLAAPGGDIQVDQNADGYGDGLLSTSADDQTGAITESLAFAQGTSVAAPQVAAVAALMKSIYPGLTPAQFDSALQSGALTEDLGGDGASVRNDQYGYGLVDALKAVRHAAALAAGGPLPPIISLSPATLNFGSLLTELSLSLGNGGGGELFISSVVSDSNWLSVSPDGVDGSGLGRYRVAVDRTDLSAGSYRGNIQITSDTAGMLTVPVTLGVDGFVASSADVGFQWVILLDAATLEQVDILGVEVQEGRYPFLFEGLAAGEYYLLSGSDMDNDFFICDAGESCGGYPLVTGLSLLRVTDDIRDLSFTSSFNPVFSSLAVGREAGEGIARSASGGALR